MAGGQVDVLAGYGEFYYGKALLNYVLNIRRLCVFESVYREAARFEWLRKAIIKRGPLPPINHADLTRTHRRAQSICNSEEKKCTVCNSLYTNTENNSK